MKRKTERQFERELMDYIISKKIHPKEARAILRACIEKRFYEKTRKLN